MYRELQIIIYFPQNNSKEYKITAHTRYVREIAARRTKQNNDQRRQQNVLQNVE